jgi:hypothetical protein
MGDQFCQFINDDTFTVGFKNIRIPLVKDPNRFFHTCLVKFFWKVSVGSAIRLPKMWLEGDVHV